MPEYSLPTVPTDPTKQSTNFQGNPTVNVLELTQKGGFFPVGTAAIVPRPSKVGFKWRTSYGRPLVETGTAAASEDLVLQVITYQGETLFNPTQLYVYVGATRLILEAHKRHYMRAQDLMVRIGPGYQQVYQNDFKVYKANKLPFYVWDETGKAVSGIDDKNFQGYFKELLTVSNNDRTDDDLFTKYCGFASAATYPQKEPWTVLSRFFDREVQNIKLFFRVNTWASKDNNMSRFEDIIEQVKKDAQKRKAFVPASYEIVLYSEPTKAGFEHGKALIGHHPQDLYDVWVEKGQLDNELSVAGMCQPHYELSDILKAFVDSRVSHGISLGKWNELTTTTVTRLKLASARSMIRKPSQDAVMGSSSSDAASGAWKSQIGAIGDAEWLHRSAFSYGGIGGKKTSASSSQTVQNLLLGTAATNTAMLRVEEFVKRYVLRTGSEMTVTTTTKDPENVLGDKKASWLAPILQYEYSDPKNPSVHKILHFDTLARLKPMRFDFEVGRLVEAVYFGWMSTLLPEEDIEKPEDGTENTVGSDDPATVNLL